MAKVSDLKYFYDKTKEADEWLDTVPKDINAAFFENTYVGAYYDMVNYSMTKIFEDKLPAADWLIFEWRKGFSVAFEGKEIEINSPEEYYAYLIEFEGWEE